MVSFVTLVACCCPCPSAPHYITRSFIYCLLVHGVSDRTLLAFDKPRYQGKDTRRHLTPVDFSFRHGLKPNTSPLFDDVDVLKQVHAMTPIPGEPRLRPLLLVRALESGGVFKRDSNGKTTSNDELEEELYGQSLPQHYSSTTALPSFTHSF